MKISSCYPMYAANDFSKAIDYLTNQQAYKILHKNAFGSHKFYTLESSAGYRLDVIYMPGEIDGVYATRVNVDDFADGYNFFISLGYEANETSYENVELRLIFLEKEGAGRICLVQHIRDKVSEDVES